MPSLHPQGDRPEVEAVRLCLYQKAVGSVAQSRLATTLDEQNDLQQRLSGLERKQRKQRQQIFEVEDEIAEKRDALIVALQRRMSQKTNITPLFTIQWQVV